MSGGATTPAGAADWATNRSDEVGRAELMETLASELLDAYASKTTVPPLRDRVPEMSIRDAYAVQTHQLNAHLAAGRTLIGHKVGLTSLAMQEQLGVDSPDFGFMLEDTLYREDARIGVDGFISPKVEPELGFILSSDLEGPGVTVDQARAAIGGIYPAIEIIDSRVADWDIALVDTVADNASFGAIALGSQPLDISVDDLSTVACSLQIDGVTRESGTGDAVMGDSAAPLAWLANILGEQGVSLRAGQVVLPGSITRALPVVAGQSATADFGDLGSLTIHFE